MKKIINSTNAPGAIGPYSQAIQAGDFLYISGQLPIDVKTGNFADSNIKGQTQQSLTNIKAICEAAGCTLENIVKVNIFLKNMNDFADMNEVYATFFNTHKPARAAVEVARLPKDALIEIEAIAYLK